MVILILTRSGLEEMRSRIDTERDAVWINAGVLQETEVVALRQSGWNLTTFTNPLHVDDFGSDIATIAEHHPGHVIWTEAVTG